MRLWHYKLIPYLPKSQLLAQWRELNSIFKKQDRHILINYIYEYPKGDLISYTFMVLREMSNRDMVIKSWDNFDSYFRSSKKYIEVAHPFKHHHTNRYLTQCFFNLQEKYDRGQKDFDELTYERLQNVWLDATTKEGVCLD